MADRASSRPGLPPWRAGTGIEKQRGQCTATASSAQSTAVHKVEKSIEQTGGAASFLDGIGQEEAYGAQSTEANVGA